MDFVGARDFHPVIQDAEVEIVFFRLELLPGHGHQDRVDVHSCESGDDCIGLGGGPRRRIAQFAAKNQKGTAVYDELACSVHHLDVRQFGGRQGREGKKNTGEPKGHCGYHNLHCAVLLGKFSQPRVPRIRVYGREW